MLAIINTKKVCQDHFVLPRWRNVSQMCQHLAVGATCRRHLGNFPSHGNIHTTNNLPVKYHTDFFVCLTCGTVVGHLVFSNRWPFSLVMHGLPNCPQPQHITHFFQLCTPSKQVLQFWAVQIIMGKIHNTTHQSTGAHHHVCNLRAEVQQWRKRGCCRCVVSVRGGETWHLAVVIDVRTGGRDDMWSSPPSISCHHQQGCHHPVPHPLRGCACWWQWC